MSLINDALKRAGQSDRDHALPDVAPAKMEPVIDEPAPRSLAALAVVLIALLMGAWIAWLWTLRDVHKLPNSPAAAPSSVSIPPVPEESPAPLPDAATPTPIPPPAQSSASPPWPAQLKLGGIFYNEINPRVLLDGDVYQAGDILHGITIQKIEKDQVMLAWQGQIKVLTLAPP